MNRVNVQRNSHPHNKSLATAPPDERQSTQKTSCICTRWPLDNHMDATINSIVSAVPSGVAFDAHYVIDTLIRDHSDTYLLYARTITAATRVTPYMHSEIAKKIDTLSGTLIDRLPHKSLSYNIRENASQCTLWLRL
ncbi:hypothetical protein EC9_45480 [Rosistilla ulvae]|uniref:Uncharacterized protein n=1 Tax=Rosistilla ulvae TaxID=1930277 RepID=A0A517M638_9BACT|nr:hypothetical protein [Rosistilla ulvae]QDS90340.1 hypothetical protein EC9_45480 [Rosistilla ulvae]